MKCRYQSGEGNGVVVLHHEGWGTYTHGWEILSSYVYYFFSSNLARGRSVTLNWVRRACGWVGEEPISWHVPLACQKWLVPPLSHVYSFASRKRVSWGNNFTSNNDLLGSSWVTWKEREHTFRNLEQALSFSAFHTLARTCAVSYWITTILCSGGVLIFSEKTRALSHMSYSIVPSSRGVSTNHKATG